ncbi:hypothetical protein HPB50_013683 [Hyalomma asiaticum]|uniref:Uncharacterized protein n=1 Tax=Hyalomma asiaticum TaxID=266040 RepID=A0ACB7TI45_HYAAI|nr:hypothetical protein HPB50_013683 [Hyalomma asiaticum]
MSKSAPPSDFIPSGRGFQTQRVQVNCNMYRNGGDDSGTLWTQRRVAGRAGVQKEGRSACYNRASSTQRRKRREQATRAVAVAKYSRQQRRHARTRGDALETAAGGTEPTQSLYAAIIDSIDLERVTGRTPSAFVRREKRRRRERAPIDRASQSPSTRAAGQAGRKPRAAGWRTSSAPRFGDQVRRVWPSPDRGPLLAPGRDTCSHDRRTTAHDRRRRGLKNRATFPACAAHDTTVIRASPPPKRAPTQNLEGQHRRRAVTVYPNRSRQTAPSAHKAYICASQQEQGSMPAQLAAERQRRALILEVRPQRQRLGAEQLTLAKSGSNDI